MDRVEALAWLARRQVWEDRLQELEAPGAAPTRLIRSSGRRAGRDQGGSARERIPVAKAS